MPRTAEDRADHQQRRNDTGQQRHDAERSSTASSTSSSSRARQVCASQIPRIYELTCEQLGVEPHEVVFLDDLGINLKPAAQMGMTTIKVIDPDVALAELEAAVGFSVR